MSGAEASATNTAAHRADTPQLLLEHHLKELRLPTILREYDKVARQCAVEQVDYQHYLLRITGLELLDRECRATERRIRQAKFPVVKTMDNFDFLAIPPERVGNHKHHAARSAHSVMPKRWLLFGVGVVVVLHRSVDQRV
jgi:DNA replication protein DnaC